MNHDSQQATREIMTALFPPTADTRRRWTEWAWSRLADTGAVPRDLDPLHPDHTEHVITLVALSYLCEAFTEAAGGSDPPEPTVDDTLFDLEVMSSVEVGRLAERARVHTSEWPESPATVLAALIMDRSRSVAYELAGLLGTNLPAGLGILAGTLFAQRVPDVSFPLTEDDLDSIVNDPTDELIVGHAWLDQWSSPA